MYSSRKSVLIRTTVYIDLMRYSIGTPLSQGFYAVYTDVFHRVGEEEVPYMDEDDEPLPLFGDSTSNYESVSIIIILTLLSI